MNDNSRLSCQVPKRSCFYIDLQITTHLVPQPVRPLVPKARVNPGYSPPPLGHSALVTVDVRDASQVVTPQASLQNCNVMWLGPQAHSFFLYSNSRRWLCQKMLPAKTPAPIPCFLSLPVLRLSLDYWTHSLTLFPGQASPQALLASSATWTPSIHHETWFKNLKIPRGEAKGVLDSAFLGVS